MADFMFVYLNMLRSHRSHCQVWGPYVTDITFPLLISVIRRLPPLGSLCPLSFSTVPNTELLCYSKSEMQLEPNALRFLFDIIPPLFSPSPNTMCLATDYISQTHGNKRSLDKMCLVIGCMDDSRWHLSSCWAKGQIDVSHWGQYDLLKVASEQCIVENIKYL